MTDEEFASNPPKWLRHESSDSPKNSANVRFDLDDPKQRQILSCVIEMLQVNGYNHAVPVASLPPEAPEGAKVTWRVNYEFVDNAHAPGCHSLDFTSREQADAFIAEEIPAEIRFLEKRIISVLKITTTESFVAVREAGK